MPAAGLPVASMTISISGAAMSERASSVTCVALDVAGLGERSRGKALRCPAGACQCRAGAIGREIGDPDDVNAGRVLRLRQVHRAEFAGADQATRSG